MFTFAILLSALTIPSHAGKLFYGDKDCLNQGCYGTSDPTARETLQGLAPNVVTLATNSFGHGDPFSPSNDFPGTDQILVGSLQPGIHDGCSTASQPINDPAAFSLEYSSLVAPGQTVTSLTLGIAVDDLQFPAISNPFTATMNGSVNAAITAQLNAFASSGKSAGNGQVSNGGRGQATEGSKGILENGAGCPCLFP